MKDQFPNIDFITLGAGHSQIIGHVPNNLTLAQVCEKQVMEKKDVSSLGLFDSSSPNYTTYYPDVKAEDLNPSDDEFIYPVFRLLSNVIVHKRHNPIEFPAEVLKASMPMLLGQTVNVDHETALGNAIGSILEVEWQESYKDKSGVVVPAGINGKLKIDGKSNPRIARGVLMSPPSIHSNSVTVRFKWKPSHEMEDMSKFWDLLGTYDENGQMYRRIVTEVVAYSETSLVNHGADPYAKMIKDGKIVNPQMADTFYSFKSEDGKEHKESKFVMIDYKNDLSEEGLSLSYDNNQTPFSDSSEEQTTPKNVINNKSNTDTMKEKLLKLCLIMGISDSATLTEDNWLEEVENRFKVANDKAANAEALQTKVDELTNSNAEFKESNAELTEKVASLTADAEVGAEALKDAREEALRLYKLAKGEKAVEEMEKVISEASYKAALAFKDQFANDSEGEFKATCKSCGSEDISRASVENTDNQEGDDSLTEKSADEVRESLRRKKKKVNSSFIEDEA